MNDQATLLRDMLAHHRAMHSPQPARALALASGQSGVGQATLAANLAVALRQAGQRVVLVDAGPSPSRAARLLGLEPRCTLREVLDGEATVPELALEGPCGVRLIAAGPGLADLADLTPWQAERLWRGFAELEEDADFVLVATAPGGAPGVLDFLAAAGEVILVTVPEADAVANTYALIKALVQQGFAGAAHVLVNRARFPRDAQSVSDRIGEVARRFLKTAVGGLGFVPEDPEVGRAAPANGAFVVARPQGAAALSLAAIARRLVGSRRAGSARSLSDALRKLLRRGELDDWRNG